MSEQNPKRLDQLFQRGSEQYDFEYNQEGWEQMESLLDKDKRRRRILWWWIFLVLLFSLSGSIWWFYTRDLNKNTNQISTETVVETDQQSGVGFSENLKEVASSDLNSNTQDTSTFAPQNEKVNQFSAESNRMDQQKHAGLSSLPFSTSGNKNKIDELKTTDPSLFNLPASVKTDSSSAEPDLPPVETKKEPLLSTQDSFQILDQHQDIMTWGIAKLSTLPFDTLSYEIAKLSLTEINAIDIEAKKNTAKPHFFMFGVLAGEEISVADTSTLTGLDEKVGIYLAYLFKNRFSLSLGANYVQKSYVAGKGAYTPPKGFWTRKIAPRSTRGICKVLEIPVLFSYYPKGIFHSGFFAKMGVTSFLMLKERYYYSYDLPDQDLVRKWYGNNESQHWFGIGQVSLGYNWPLGTSASLQVAPYFQVPFIGLGHGDVKLWSLGINTNFSFRLNK